MLPARPHPTGRLLQMVDFIEHDQRRPPRNVLAMKRTLVMHLAVRHDDAVGVARPRAVAVAVVGLQVQAEFVSGTRPLAFDVGGRGDDGDLPDAAGADEFARRVHRPERLARSGHGDEQVVLLQLAEIVGLR